MNKIMLIIDGMTDRMIINAEEDSHFDLNGYPNIKYMKNNGDFGFFETTPEGVEADSLSCILTLLGVSSEEIPGGRAYVESAAQAIPSCENDLILRCNIVRVNEGILASSCCEELSQSGYEKAVRRVSKFLRGDIKLYHMSSYKHILTLKDAAGEAGRLDTYPPHKNIGKNINSILPTGAGCADMLRDFIELSRIRLEELFPGGGYMYIPWSPCTVESLPGFSDLWGVKTSIVCQTEIVRGVAVCMNINSPKLKNATADTDTDLAEKAKTATELLKSNELVIIHVNGADEASHRLDPVEKHAFLREIDKVLIEKILNDAPDDTSILICCDHASNPASGNHEGGVQPFVLFNKSRQNKGYIGIRDGKSAIKLLCEH